MGSTAHESAERRRQILETARRLLTHYGPQKTTIAEIAREAGVGVGTVYLDFASKEAILAELSRVEHDEVLQAMRAGCAASSGRSVAKRLRSLLHAKVTCFIRLARQGAHAKDLVHCVHAAAIREEHARFQNEERTLVAALLREGATAQELAVDDPERVARVVLRAYVSFSPPWVFAEPEDEIAALLEQTHEVVLYGLVARVAPVSVAGRPPRRGPPPRRPR